MPEEGEKKDVEMKDAKEGEEKEGEAKETTVKKDKEPPKDPRTLMIESIGTALKTINAAIAAGDSRVMGRVARSINGLRRTVTPDVLRALLEETVSSSNKALYLSSAPVADVPMGDDEKAQQPEVKFPNLPKPHPPEMEAFAVLVLLVQLTDRKENDKALECGSKLVMWLKAFNRRTLDILSSRAYFYLSLAYERSGKLSDLRPELLAAYRTACLRHDAMGQATLLNLLLRNYLAYNLYEQALKLVQKTSFPESRPNAQYARYLLYIGQIKAVQLEYSDSHSKLLQALRKAPPAPNVALGFKLAATKLAVIVELLMGGIPDRATFVQKELKEGLRPYYALTQAVRTGDLNAFKEQTQRHEALFKKDKMLTFINRLRYNVIKTGLRDINLSYSRISLQDVCTKLGLETAQDAAGVVAKAVVDGVIDATIDYDQQALKSTQKFDLYSSCEPQKAFHKRIAFCLQMHNDAVKSMAYPDETKAKDGEDAEERREREKRDMADISVEDDDDDMLL